MMQDEFHQPFLKSLLSIVFVTVFSVISIHYAMKYYSQHNSKDAGVLIYTAQESKIMDK